ncbi:hypothetical protein PGT21_001535 [Puccinia graminis f. sp. tritici]|uniref:Brix domain-containing protein n=2 Tax=Puccinia graminis f. sp. tritici TaxID=56615 RepID=E3KJR9_PUCGT|nr:uncharacterized protein PGTG_10703 [Puccinia graminis f. sp. tritici CRL 75-36-700-3]EFP84544.1 hypothetical protein PGTG_10703 [Puccinia graminis f. sp. tritici CRL 75-36-700-3]KAA1097273.1 hypothetical protein PGT21_001449 [Puccinia graminis f. sp. tritici]KAA1100920.1 hypothetical protein PGT21_001535 [Puccinia graminis f. sp. tritici]KAA1134376.1 hypothetical protein PGTUg99_035897 [Puccinia graminis f. sp. tritici]
MAKRKKNRTHKKAREAGAAAAATTAKSPKSFIIKSTRAHHTSASATRSPHHSTSLNLLVKDFRKVMEPNTASHLRERKSNKFKDFLAMAGPLSVTHILVFSQSEMSTAKQLENQSAETELISNLNLKIYKVPRGPTLTFKILRFSLMIDILNSDKHPRSPGAEFKTEPLLIMNNFNPDANATAEDVNRLNLLTTTFRNLFPQIKVHEIQLVQTRRVVLLSYNPTTRTIDFRHYLITVKPIGVSKALRKLMQGVSVPGQRTDVKSDKRNKHLLDLGSIEDVAEYLLGKGKAGPGSTASSSGFTGARSENTEDGNQSDYDGLSSEGEDESEGEEANDRRVELPQNYLGRGNIKNTKKAIRLREIGPRMELGLIKIEQGLGGGDILYHELIKKSKGEDQRIKKKIKEKEALKSQRKKEQQENVKRKAMEKEAKKKSDNKESKKTDVEAEGLDGAADEDHDEAGDEDGEEEEEGSEIDEEAELSDIFSELAYSEAEDDEDGHSSSPSPDQSEAESDHEKKAPQVKNSRKKVKFSKSC